MSANEPIMAYCSALQRFNADTMDEFLELCSDAIEFRDPFNHTYYRQAFRSVLEHMLETVAGLRFAVHETWGSNDSWVIKWSFTGRAKAIGLLDIDGISEIHFDARGKVDRHIDYWDASEHFDQKIPILGRALRAIHARLNVER
jgi:steroid delta-isomerase